jgi:hypothetical protein
VRAHQLPSSASTLCSTAAAACNVWFAASVAAQCPMPHARGLFSRCSKPHAFLARDPEGQNESYVLDSSLFPSSVLNMTTTRHLGATNGQEARQVELLPAFGCLQDGPHSKRDPNSRWHTEYGRAYTWRSGQRERAARQARPQQRTRPSTPLQQGPRRSFGPNAVVSRRRLMPSYAAPLRSVEHRDQLQGPRRPLPRADLVSCISLFDGASGYLRTLSSGCSRSASDTSTTTATGVLRPLIGARQPRNQTNTH